MKSDARVRYTKHIIQDVFLDLLKEFPLYKITVTEICERADINRGTFYKHYNDVYDLLRQLENAALNKLESLLQDSSKYGNIPVLTTLLTSLLEYKDLIETLMPGALDNEFLTKLADCCSQYAIAQIPSDDNSYLDDPNKQYIYSYLAGGTTMLIEQWIKADAKEAPAVVAEKIEALNQHILSIKL